MQELPSINFHWTGRETKFCIGWNMVREEQWPNIMDLRLIELSQLSQLTDKGMNSTLALGCRLRHLYIYQLGFMPKKIDDNRLIHLRATSYKRAQESLQQVFLGLYPENTRARSFSPPPVVVREPDEETLLPNEEHCPRFTQLFRAFSERTAIRC